MALKIRQDKQDLQDEKRAKNEQKIAEWTERMNVKRYEKNWKYRQAFVIGHSTIGRSGNDAGRCFLQLRSSDILKPRVPTRGVKSQYKFESRSDGINPSSQLRSSDTLQPWVPTRGNKSQYDFESRSDGISQIQQLAQFDRLHFNNRLILFGSFVPFTYRRHLANADQRLVKPRGNPTAIWIKFDVRWVQVSRLGIWRCSHRSFDHIFGV